MTGRGWLDGTTALLIGGGSGIGRAVVDAFVAEGAAVAVLEVSPERCDELASSLPEVLTIPGDATRWEDNRRAVAVTLERFGRLDTVVNFVGLFDYYIPLADIPADDLDAAFAEIFDANVKSCLWCVKAATEALRATAGSVVLTLSTSSFYPGRGGALYVATKFAARGLVVQLGHELAPEVRVNGVAPGGTLGTALRGIEALGLHNRRLGETSDREADLAARSPLDIALRPEDHAGAYVLLASGRARGITGTIIQSDGGLAIRG